ncbi:MAG: hypothetical protein KAS32_19350 [Candidatus Peribacteraceae bacterium]|nr:hypothetical protein [Candidatus Peribacteraceae bacterium]
MPKLTGFSISEDLTDKYEPHEEVCNSCGHNSNFFVYKNEDSTEFIAGCCLCSKYGEKQPTPFKATIDWVKRHAIKEQRF